MSDHDLMPGLCALLAEADSLPAFCLGLNQLVGPTPLALDKHEGDSTFTLWTDLGGGKSKSILPLGDWGQLRISPAARKRLLPLTDVLTAALRRLEAADRQRDATQSDGKPVRPGRQQTALAGLQQHAARQQTILDALLNTAPVGVALTDQNGNLLLHNRRFLSLFGFAGNLPVGMDMGLLRRFFADGRRFVTWLQDLPVEAGRTIELDVRQTEPEIRFLNFMTAPAFDADGRLTGRLFIIRDMTREANVDQMKNELINVVSHELRTPLTSVLGFAELVLTRDLTIDKIRQYVGTIYSEGKRLSSLLDDFLDINRLESRQQPYHMRVIHLGPIIRKVSGLFSSNQAHPIEVQVPTLPAVRGDGDRLVQALSNLVSNAIKYSPDGGPVLIRATHAPDAHRIVVQVSDKGLGIPKDAIGQLFSKFYRVHRPGRHGIGGTGLGLAICQEIIKAHSGEIWCESVDGKGSTFSFSLPLRGRNIPKPDVVPHDTSPTGMSDYGAKPTAVRSGNPA
ncbi:MAG: PAS domain-containing protein [Candidatus Sericytochromatia bacterium]|nr:PAS domain-containing protein [Candidatus Sericytochromatia bacterium]